MQGGSIPNSPSYRDGLFLQPSVFVQIATAATDSCFKAELLIDNSATQRSFGRSVGRLVFLAGFA